MNRYTPAIVSKNPGMLFQIPLYQRLFEWDDEQINQLMNDLQTSFTNTPERPYYIGMLTSKVSDVTELVDGQQRFTVMVLLGIYFGWNDFLYPEDEFHNRHVRLQFRARKTDQDYLKSKIEGTYKPDSSSNNKMESGLKCISDYIEKAVNNGLDKVRFGEYIFNNLTFFLSELPQDYTSYDLNTYFERMNTTGKALENYEIIKVELLRRLSDDPSFTNKKETYTKLWNAVSQMDRMLLTQRNQYKEAILNTLDGRLSLASFDSGVIIDEITTEDRRNTIMDIKESNNDPSVEKKRRTGEHTMLTFQEFLLQILFITCGYSGQDIVVTDFFDVNKLNGTFRTEIDKGLNVEKYLDNLLLYRLLTDYFLICIDDEGDDLYPFELYCPAKEEESGNEMKQCVKQFQSMLYSASSSMTYYHWMPKILSFLRRFVEQKRDLTLSASDFLKELKAIDNQWHPSSELECSGFNYPTIDRYWFWRMDYYLWEGRGEYFHNKEDLDIVCDYVFRRNRSIEHIAPQFPEGASTFQWDDQNNSDDKSIRDSFGNLVMISSGQNSSLSNQPFEKKRVHMELYSNGKLNGRVESLKMYYVYRHYAEWDRNSIIDHGRFSINFLKRTY